jgi:hypothetical protein
MKMSIHRALAELKTLDKRIDRAVNEKFVELQIGEEAPKGYKELKNFVDDAQANYQSAKALIERRNTIKCSITASNAETEVTIAGKQMTVASAIDRRDTSLQYDKALLVSLRRQLSKVEMEIERERQDVERRLEQRIQSDLGPKDRKTNADEVENITKAFLKRYKPDMVDPIKIKEEITRLTNDIEQFEMEVDFTLSESNTSTLIDIED